MNPFAKELFLQAIEALKPGHILKEQIQLGEGKLRIAGFDWQLKNGTGIWLIAAGKASIEMAGALEKILGDTLKNGIVVTSYDPEKQSPTYAILKGSHPVPDRHSMHAGEQLLKFVQEIPGRSIVINCLSGGASSLLTAPAEGITIEDLNRTYELLNNSGANIREINTVRKHLSKIKGGQLLRYFDSSITLIDLVISDVPDDDLEIIGSGPTTPDSTSYQDTYHVLLEYELWDRLPERIGKHIEKGLDGIVPETLKPGEETIAGHHQIIIGSARKLAEKTAEYSKMKGYNTWIAPEAYNKDVREVARDIAGMADTVKKSNGPVLPPAVLVFYGESTVNVKGNGKGGRNQELALTGALETGGNENITWLSVGTDGIDGPTDAAGAIIDGNTIAKAKKEGINPQNFLDANDSYHFHEKAGTLLKTGPTGNNLMDLQIVIVE